MKKGQAGFSTERLMRIILTAGEIIAVVLIITGIGYVIREANKPEPDRDFKRVLDATAKIIENFDDGRIQSNAEMVVPLFSKQPYEMAFFRDGGTEDRCGGKPCLCIYYDTPDGPKTTCKIFKIKQNCTKQTCGEELCAGATVPPHTKAKGSAAIVTITCTTRGTELTVS